MKKIIVLLCLMLAICSLHGQNDFIEVEVFGEFEKSVVSYQYLISINHSRYHESIQQLTKEERLILHRKKCAELETLLDDNSYDYDDFNTNEFEIQTDVIGKEKMMILVSLQSKKEILLLVKKLESLGGIKGEIFNTIYEESTISDDNYKMLFEKAKKKASTLAKLSDRQLGQVKEITEITPKSSNESSFSDALLNSSVIPGWHSTIIPSDSSEKLYLKVKFALE